ncbi:MAG: helicase-related protein [Candidatus Paceibacterota bacterium]
MDTEAAKLLITENRDLSFEESFQLSQLCSKLLNVKDASIAGRDLIIRVLDIWERIPASTQTMWKDLIEAAGFYPYLEKQDLCGAGLLRREYHRSKYLSEETYLHAEQMDLSIMLDTSNSLIVSAPTSFGKSKLIEEIVASGKYNNIVIIQPTLALLDETRKKLRKYASDYNMVVTTTQKPQSGKNLFLFTGERVAEYEHFPAVDFFVIDEFYKLSIERDDERAASLNHALYKLLSMTHKFYMLGPSINSIPPGFAERHNAVWFKTDFATVAVDIERIWEKVGRAKEEEKEAPLFDLLKDLREPTIIYCSSPNKTNKLTQSFLKYVLLNEKLKSELQNNNNDNAIDWIKENIHEDWILAKSLKYSIGMHHGALPRHLSSSIIDFFNRGDVRYLFCTSTLIEGVNTSAKNVVLFDEKKGSKAIDYFDFKNIAGRSGRMKEHFIGKVFQFHKEPKQEELDIDIPLFTQTNAPLELLVQIDPKEIKETAMKKLVKFSELSNSVQELIKQNKGVSVEGQMTVIDILRNNIDTLHDKISWSGVPCYPELVYVISLAWEHFRTVRSSEGGAHSPKHLATLTLQYIGTKSIRGMIDKMVKSDYWVAHRPDIQERIEIIVDTVLQVNQHWFRYKLPKWLSVLSEIQKFVCQEKGLQFGDYGVLANLIENSFLPSHLGVLLEYGLPPSAIRKIGDYIKEEMEPEKLIAAIKRLDPNKLGLLPYEVDKLKDL